MLKKAILLLNMGGPGKLEEVEIFLKNMFNDPFILSIKSSYSSTFINGIKLILTLLFLVTK